MISKFFLLKFAVLVWILSLEVEGDTEDAESASDIKPLDYLEMAKRSHNIMRFGKRMAEDGYLKQDHHIIRFGKRGLGIVENGNRFPELFRILRSEDRDSWKRGHNIMRFGKRFDDHHFIHFGKKSDDDEIDDIQQDIDKSRQLSPITGLDKRYFSSVPFNELSEESLETSNSGSKRYPHSMIHFGKRIDDSQEEEEADENPLTPEKREHSMIHFGKKDEPYDSFDKRSHQMIHFGKRIMDSEEDDRNEDEYKFGKRAHSMIHFGKRAHALMHFGKRAHSLMHFGKRYGGGSGMDHNMMHFGKRPHDMMHFGKRDTDEENQFDKRATNHMLHFGKRLNNDKSNDFIHFGKRGGLADKNHNMLHFGKRDDSNEGNAESAKIPSLEQLSSSQKLEDSSEETRTKRSSNDLKSKDSSTKKTKESNHILVKTLLR